MGWLIRRNNSSKRKKGKASAARSKAGATTPFARRHARILITSLALLGVGIAWYVGLNQLQAYHSRRSTGYVQPDAVVLVDAPVWLNKLTEMQLRQAVSDYLLADPLDQRSLKHATESLAASPWVSKVQQITRQRDGQVLVNLVYRSPLALVRTTDGYALVASDGVRLPGLYLEHQLAHVQLPVIVGVSAASPKPGQPWPGEDLRAGLNLVSLLAGEDFAGQIMAYDVSGRDQHGRLTARLITNRGTVLWGFAPGMEGAIEPTAVIKRDRLRALAQRHDGRIDAGGHTVNLRTDRVTIINTAGP